MEEDDSLSNKENNNNNNNASSAPPPRANNPAPPPLPPRPAAADRRRRQRGEPHQHIHLIPRIPGEDQTCPYCSSDSNSKPVLSSSSSPSSSLPTAQQQPQPQQQQPQPQQQQPQPQQQQPQVVRRGGSSGVVFASAAAAATQGRCYHLLAVDTSRGGSSDVASSSRDPATQDPPPRVVRTIRYPGDFEATFRVVLVGSSGVGKSALLRRYCDHEFDSDRRKATVGIDFKTKDLLIGDKAYRLNIFDTAGQERFRAVTKSYYRGVHCVILVYDISNRNSFLELEDWCEDALENMPKGALISLVGTKRDKEDQEGGRQVTYDEGMAEAERFGASVFCEASSKSGKNVRELFTGIVGKIVQTPGLLEAIKLRPYAGTVELGLSYQAWVRSMLCYC
ncbi:P-loop containing nucleoside triphosphate hydrolase protein [Chaetomidium leptoderma]|uniref:P-loop containing nucleoside triphosphate hydrolase protein n=1 Tax=Chaetomidium leptoderma TaxID=669021 RepID=A0AAN6VHB8_9PEZI|nr:P-loop containing nucleoside triphosphate hydrolase protein [Chaetomidium leptoderma]